MADPDRRRVDELFDAALERPPSGRARWLASACGGEPEILAEVLELLAAHEMAGGILDAEPLAPRDPALAPGLPGQRRIGHYRVIRELGRGGMGVVYLGERDDGQFRRLVAIKLLLGGPGAAELRERFVAERQILASLDHPHIAQLLDAGVTDGELPYLVMEYVDGLPITSYCDRHRLGVDDRLRLFRSVCAAVHHAHRNLVIHRDLKPGNILVTGDGQVKLLDFGIAKLQNPGMSPVRLPVTRAGQRVMTPEYASPEQVLGGPVSTTSDVYSLGVVLYELLAGSRPYELDARAPGEVANLVGDREPARPSTAAHGAGSAASARDTTPDRLVRTLRGDLDAIVMMALRKEPGRRYGSADLLMEDIHRYLEGLPVLAHEGSRRYYAGKFLRRHRTAMSVAGLAALSLLSGAGVAFWQASIANAERDRATAGRARTERALTESEAVTRFLVGLFESSDPAETGADGVSADDLLRRGAARIDALSGEPLIQAHVLEALGRVYHSMGRSDDARDYAERALRIRQAQLGDGLEVAGTLNLLADIIRRQGRYAEAEARAREALGIQERVLGPDHLEVATTLLRISSLAIYRGDIETAEALSRRAFSIRDSNPGTNDSLRAASLVHLADVIRKVGKYDEAEAHLRRAVALSRRRFGPDHPATTEPVLHLAYFLADRGRLDEAEPLVRTVLDIQRRAGGTGSPTYAYVLGDLADVRSRKGDHEAALNLFRRELAQLRRIFGPDYSGLASVLGQISVELVQVGRLADAEAAVREGLEIGRRSGDEAHQYYGGLLADLAGVLQHQGRLTEAEVALHQAIGIRSAANGPETRNVGLLRSDLGAVLLQARRYADAETELAAALSIVDRTRMPEEEPQYQLLLRRMGDLYEASGRPADAARLRARLLALGAPARERGRP